MPEAFDREATQDGIVVRIGTDGLLERRVCVRAGYDSIDSKPQKKSPSVMEVRPNSAKPTMVPSNQLAHSHCGLPMSHDIA